MKAGRMAEVVGCLPSKPVALSSKPSITKKKKKAIKEIIYMK
jgi:hypothetical protein